MQRKRPMPPLPVEDETFQLIDTKPIADAAITEALNGIKNPAVYNNPRARDAIIFLTWNKMVSTICRLTHRGDMRRWGLLSRRTKERHIESLFPGISFRKFETLIMSMLGFLIHSRTSNQKRPQP